MRTKRHLARLGGIAGVAALLVTAAAVPAAATEETLKMGNIVFGRGGVIRSGYRVYACDMRADGEGIRTEYQLNNGFSDSVGDANGSAGDCGYENTPGQYYAVKFRVCMPSVCTIWVTA